MSIPSVVFRVTRPSEGGYIPTLGHSAANYDLYRVAEVDRVTDRPQSWCFTDTVAAASLGRVIDGPIAAASDLSHAEAALRAILLHEFVDVLVPCVKTRHQSGLIAYSRFDRQERNEASFAGMNSAPCRDTLLAVELVSEKEGAFVESSNPASELIGVSIEDQPHIRKCLNATVAELALALPMQLKAAESFATPEFRNLAGESAAGFISELYQRTYRQWMGPAQSEPALFMNIALPPLIAIVLSRAPHRSHIPTVLRDLREEMSAIRSDLHRLNDLLDGSTTQAEIQGLTQRVYQSFDAVVPEALLTPVERRARRFLELFSFARKMPQVISATLDPISIDPEKIAELFDASRTAVLGDSRIVRRYISALRISELLRIESVHGILTTHFSPEEQRLFSQATAPNQR